MMFDFVGKRHIFFLISFLVILPGVISLIMPGGLRPGIDFSSGSLMTVRFEQQVDQTDLRQTFADLGHSEAIVQRTGGEGEGSTFLIRTFTLQGEQRDESGTVVRPSERQLVEDALRNRFGNLEVLAFDSVSPIIAQEIVQNAIIAVAAASLGILLYIWYAFRRVKNSFRWGTAAVVALVHDALIVIGAFSILGRIFHIEIDAMFITAVLTVIGYSVHNTIVVFDRVRENYARRQGELFEAVVNHSLMQTLGRSMNTSLTVLLVLFALYLFGGVTTQTFILAMIIGIIAGTYSSLFIAGQYLVAWESGEFKGLWKRLTGGRRKAAAPAR
jgi:preprotein translocase subunit SecF